MPDDATGIADSHHIRRQVPNDHACANLSATVRSTSRNGKNRTLGNENGSEGSKFPAFHPAVLPPDVIAGGSAGKTETVPFVVLWNLLQVEAPNLLPAKEQVEAAVFVSRTEGHFLAAKGLTDVKEVPLEFDLALGSHQAHKTLRKVLNFRQFGRHR